MINSNYYNDMKKNDYIKYDDNNIQSAFEKVVKLYSNKLAIVEKEKALTYNQLNSKINKMANYFVNNGISKGTRVVIVAERRIESVVAIIALIKIGAVYVPVDPEYPKYRVDFIIEDCNAKVICCYEDKGYNTNVICINEIDYENQNDENPQQNTELCDPAYITYTSGTTGVPKGVIISQKAIVKLMYNAKYDLLFKDSDVVAQFSSMSTTASVSELFFTFLVGATFVVTTREDVLNVKKYEKWCILNKVNVLITSPRYYMELNIPNIDRVITLGEAINTDIINKIPEHTEYINLYGTSETGGAALFWHWDKKTKDFNKLPIGKCSKNVEAFIIKDGRICDKGEVGELCIVTDGLTSGYLNQKELTDEKIKPNPYGEGRIYHSGDRAVLKEDYTVVYMGRVDDQVKINGNRVELSEVDSVIKEEEAISSSAVIAKKNQVGEDVIYAYIVSNEKVNIDELRRRLSQKIPQYMIPSYIMQIEKIPLTHNGKLDRNNLPDIANNNSEVEREFENEIEEKLFALYRKILGVNNFNCKTSFFSLGGQSLKAIKLINEIEKEFNCLLDAEDIFKNETVEKLSKIIMAKANTEIDKTIVKCDDREYYEASSTQKSIYLVCQSDKTGLLYNLPRCFVFNGELDVEKLKKIFNEIIQRHEVLRTSFLMHNGKLVQKINENVEPNFVFLNDDSEIEKLVDNFIKPFDMSDDSLVRMQIVHRKNDYVVLLDMHHIISDGTSYDNFIKEINNLYTDKQLEVLDLQYRHYSEWINSRNMNVQREYWMKEIGKDITTLNLPLDYSRNKNRSYDGKTICLTDIKPDLRKRLKEFCENNHMTEYMVYMSALMITLSKYSRQDEIMIGSPFSCRTKQEMDNMMGMFANTLVLKGNPDKEKKLYDFLEEIKEKCINAYINQEYPFEQLVEELNVQYDASRNPLFDVMLVMENYEQNLLSFGNTVAEEKDIVTETSKFDLSFYVFDRVDYSIKLEYCTDLFSEETAWIMLQHFMKIVEEIVTSDKDINIKSISMLNLDEKSVIESKYNKEIVPIKHNDHILAKIQEQIVNNPYGIAVTDNEQQITYQELDWKSNSLAVELQKRGVKEKDFVVVMFDRSDELVATFLAVLKIGAVYVPIDVSTPADRVKYICNDCNAKIIVASSNEYEDISEVLIVDNIDDLEDVHTFETSNSDLDSIMYCIYTSGTTGKPKGVLQKVRTISNLVLWEREEMEFDNSIISALASPGFDVSVQEISTALALGCNLVTFPDNIKKNSALFCEYVLNNKVNTVFCTPSYWDVITSNASGDSILNQVRTIILAGEAMFLNDKCKSTLESHIYYNHYGPTETHVVTSIIVDDIEQKITIGRPIANHKVIIMNDNSICSIGEPGELCVYGQGIAEGYLGRKELSNEKFVSIPGCEGKVYRTGDLARWLPDGEIEYLGRMDKQVKIRGFRVELGEVENVIRHCQGVKDCTVVVQNDNGENNLVGYLVSDDELDLEKIKEEIREKLPEYMIPLFMLQIENVPVTINGKLDEKRLPRIEIKVNKDFIKPETELEKVIYEIYKQIFKTSSIGVNQDFFELGGHSLKAMKIVGKVNEKCEIDVTIQDIFNYPSIGKLAKYIQDKQMEKRKKPIEKCSFRQYYAMSSSQKRMYVVSQMDETGILYNIPGGFMANEDIDCERMEYAVNEMIKRHEILRTAFLMKDGELVQNVLDDVKADFEEVIERNADDTFEICKYIKPFSLSSPPCFRMKVIKNERNSFLFLDMHHIISDGTSYWNFMNELFDIYNGGNSSIQDLQYKDYSEWMRSRNLSSQREYWKNELSGDLPIINLPYDYARSANQSFEGLTICKYSNAVVKKGIQNLAKKHSVTQYMVLLAAFIVMLKKYTNQTEIIVGTPIANRINADTEKMLGMFVNTLPIRVKLEENSSFIDCLTLVRSKCLSAYENQEYPFESIVEDINVDRDASRNPVFDVMFSLQNTTNKSNTVSQLKQLDMTREESNISKFDITLNIEENEDEYCFQFEFCTKLFDKDSIVTMANHYQMLLEEILKDDTKLIDEISMISIEESKEMLISFNGKKTLVSDKNLIELIEKNIDQYPERVCAQFGEESLNYGELDRRANAIAVELINRGVVKNDIVAIYAERSLEMLIGLLGVMKAGAVYIPIDPVYPIDRVTSIIEDAQPKVILTYGVEYFGNVDAIDLAEKTQEIIERPVVNRSANDGLYMIYTSGTTGNSKGALITNGSFVNLMHWYIEEFNLSEKDRVMLMASFGFDLAQKNIYAPLLTGGCLNIYDQWNYDSDSISKEIQDKKITVINCAPSVFYPVIYSNEENEFVKLKSLRLLFLGGEIINKENMEKWINSSNFNTEIVNTYGPTECTDIATFYRCRYEDLVGEKSIPIGKPINNVDVFILDENGNLAGIGVPGELCIAGAGVSKGYWNKEELTNKVFIENHFGNGRIYKSGDIARWKEDGNLEFIGRKDNQVKIRGFRIELQEIKAHIKRYPGVLDVAVIVREYENREKNICAYFVAKEKIAISNLRSYLKSIMPLYMIPAYFMQVDNIPVTQNGKLDEKRLPVINVSSDENVLEPQTEDEIKLCALFEKVLAIEHVGVQDNFFELGGHSLKAARLVNLIDKEFGVKIMLKSVFQYSTVKELLELIEAQDTIKTEVIPKAEEKDYYPMSSTQKRTYLNCKIDDNGMSYNSPYCFVLTGNVDCEKINHTIQKIVDRHEILRTSFEMIDGELYQRIQNHIDVKVEVEENENIDEKEAVSSFVRVFDLEKPPLFRVKIIKRIKDFLMLWDIHHIVSDGISIAILVNEFNDIYNGREVEVLSYQYKDYSEWMSKRDISVQKQYWVDLFSDEVPVLNLPLDYVREQKLYHKGNVYRYVIPMNISKKIKEISCKYKVTEFMIFMSSLMVLLGKYSMQSDIVVGSPISARTHQDLEKIMGMFVNTLALRGKPEDSKEYLDFLFEIKDTCLKAYENQEYPFEELVEEIKIQRDISRNPLFDVMLTMQNTDQVELRLDGVLCENVLIENSEAKFDLSIDIMDSTEGFEMIIEYANELFTKETIILLAEHFEVLLAQIIGNINVKIGEIDLISDYERKKILKEFNNTYVEFDTNKFIMDYFEEQVEKTPDKVAIIYNSETITYRELNNTVNIVANKLIEYGVEAEQFVALLMERSIETTIGMLAVLKAGGAYVPLDIRYPQDRINYMIKDCSPKVILTNIYDLETENYPVLNLSECRKWEGNKNNIPRRNKMSNLAYCIYTSGTTGTPKGVLIEHKGFYNLMMSYEKIYELTEEDVVLQVANYVFDQSVWDTFNVLIAGGTLCLISYYDVRNPREIANVCNRNGVTIASFTPAMLAELNPEEFKTMRVIDSSGEAANTTVLKRWCDKCTVINTYGPTEVTVNTSSYKFEGDTKKPISIGKPIDNYQMYVVKNNRLCGIGIPGELCISGIGVARGYLNAEQLTSEKFVENPFGEGLLYKTGDLVRWLPDGNVEYFGRMDEQVKVRGYRIELGDIDTTLRKIDEIKDCYVTVSENDYGDKAIYAYLVSDSLISIADIKYELKKELPEYMIPTYIYQIERIPFTASGKVDRRALPKDELDSEVNYVEPADEVERMICEIFSKILGIRRVGAEDDFFMLGGHSLLAIKLSMALEEEGYQFSIKDIFSYSIVRDIAKYLKGEEVEKKVSTMELMDAVECDMQTDIVSDNKVLLAGIEPFNECFYKSCFYNALFTGIKYYGLNPYSIIANSVPTYTGNENTIIEVAFEDSKSWVDLLKDGGVYTTTLNECENVVEIIKDCMKEKGIAIVQIDGYYSPIRNDLYNKIHWAHNILIYGFDDSKGEFNIVEQSDRYTLDYKRMKMSYYDLECAYRNGIAQFVLNPYEPPIVMLRGNVKDNSSINPNELKSEFINIIKINRELLEKNINTFGNDLINYFDLRDIQTDKINMLIENVNKIIEAKKVLKLILNKLINGEKSESLAVKSIEAWEILRAKMVRVSLRRKVSDKEINACKEQIKIIIEQEKAMISLLCLE